MSESAEPATDAVEVEENDKQQAEEEQLEEQKSDTLPPAVEIVDEEKEVEKEEEMVQETISDNKEEAEQEVEETQEIEHEEEQQEQEEQEENPLEDLQETMQLPNISDKAIEDEEMPSMVTISSPSKIDESETNFKQDEERDEERRFVDVEGSSPKSSPKKEEDNDSDSVCVIDDDDDEEEEERDGSSYDEEESSSYHDDESEEMSRDQYDDYHRRRQRNTRRHEDEEYDEEEVDDEEEMNEDEDEYSDPDGFDGYSDDVMFRQSHSLSKEQRERSASLQDLRLIQGISPTKQNVNPFSSKARLERNQINMERRAQAKPYSHVQSKVKKYIEDMSEQRKLSGEKRKQAQEQERRRTQEAMEAQVQRHDEVSITCRTIKNYAEKTLKEVAEYEQNEDMYVVPGVGNGEISIFPRRSVGNGDPLMRQDEMEVDPIDVESQKDDEIIDRVNGSVLNENQNCYIPERKGILRREENNLKPVLNGEEETNIICNLDSMTYEEYMKGSTQEADEVIHTESITVETVLNTPEKCNNNESEASCIFRIENVVSNYSEEKVDENLHDRTTPIAMVSQSTETHYQESPEVNSLRTQLEQKNAQFNNLRDAYQKTMQENLSMKMEIENLKKMVSQYQEQQKPVIETKGRAVQTEVPNVARNMPLIDIDEQDVDPKLGTTSMISAVSTQWSDSTGSVGVSMEPPPNVTNAINSDESANQEPKSSSKTKNAFSRAFVTSTRILQTLSSITHGKTRLDRFSNKRRVSPVPQPGSGTPAQKTQVAPSNSKKRKATDAPENSQPAKIPNTGNIDQGKKAANNEEPQFVNLDDETNIDNNGANVEETNDDNEAQEIEDDDVKVFVYPEDEEGREHSFLIQAREITDNPKPGVRECGPYLLGNVEVYMTEMNGTINIWGKELSQGSTNQNIEEMEASPKSPSKDLKTGFRWQSTPRIFNNKESNSTSKKSRIMPRFSSQQKRHNSHDVNRTIVDCENCSSHQRLSWPSCTQSMQENQHTCCPSVRVEDVHHGCAHNVERWNTCSSTCCRCQKRFSLPNVHQEDVPHCYNNHHNHCRNVVQEEPCRHQTFVRRHSFNPTDEEENEPEDEESAQLNSNYNHSLNENTPHSCNSSHQVTQSSRKTSTGEEPSACQSDDPLIAEKQNPDLSSETGKRKNGKKVRTLLMDLLKGCGDCRTFNSMDKNLRHSASIYEPSTSGPRISCAPNRQACSLRSNDKCSQCRVRNDKTAEFEAQLEFFRVEMDKIRNRSDTLRQMLDTLHNTDIKN